MCILFVDIGRSTVRPTCTLIRMLFVHKHSTVVDYYLKYAILLSVCIHCKNDLSDALVNDNKI